MTCASFIQIDSVCTKCGEYMEVSKHYHGSCTEDTYFVACEGACYIERNLDIDDTETEISKEQYDFIINTLN